MSKILSIVAVVVVLAAIVHGVIGREKSKKFIIDKNKPFDGQDWD